LRGEGGRGSIRLLQLQGSLFFGTVGQLEDRFKETLDIGSIKSAQNQMIHTQATFCEWRHLSGEAREEAVRYLILDLERVVAIDFSGAQCLARLKDRAATRGIALLFSGVSPEVRSRCEGLGCYEALEIQGHRLREIPGGPFEYPSVALRWCEEDKLSPTS